MPLSSSLPGPHPIADGAQKVDFTADEAYSVTPLAQPAADLFNQYTKGFDLVYISHDMLFWGARNIDGRGFDTEENRPTNLQIPMIRI